MKTVFIFEGFGAESLGDVFPYGPKDCFILDLSQNIFAAEKFAHLGLKVKYTEDYLSRQELEKIISDAKEKAQELFLYLNASLNYQNRLSLPEVMRYDNVILLIEILRDAALLKKVLLEEKEISLVIYESNSLLQRVCTEFATQHSLKLQIIRSKNVIPQFSLYRRYKKILTLKKFLFGKVVSLIQFILDSVRGSKYKNGKRLLILDYFRFAPLVKRLAIEKDLKTYILGSRRRKINHIWDRKEGTSFPLLFSYLNWREYLGVFSMNGLIKKIKKEIKINLKNKIIYNDLNIGPILYSIFSDYLDEFLFNYLAFYHAINNLLDKENIDTVIINQDSVGYNKILTLLCKQKDIRSICFQHGLTPDIPELYSKFYSDEVFVWGEREKEFYKRTAIAEEARMRLTGDPFLENLRHRKFDKADVCQKLNLDPHRKIILFACERYINIYLPYIRLSTYNKNLDFVTSVFSGLKDMQLVVRAKVEDAYNNSYGGFKFKRQIVEKNNQGNIIIDSQSNIYDLLYICDAAIVTISTIGLEAMLFKKPVIVMNLDDSRDDAGYVSAAAAVGVFEKADFIPTLNRCLFDADTREKMFLAQEGFLKKNFINLKDADYLKRTIDAIL